MFNDLNKVLDAIKPTDTVLDVGGGPKPLVRANYIIDIIPYSPQENTGSDLRTERRAEKGHFGVGPEQFSEKTWFVVDFSAHQKFPLPDKSVDFVFCSHTLEDIGDPLWVCQEMMRVGKRGYIEVPSRALESAKGVGGNWKVYKNYLAGFYHHRWFVENKAGILTFTFKSPLIHFYRLFQIPAHLIPKENTFLEFWWEDTFEAKESLKFGAPQVLEDMRDFKCDYYFANVPGSNIDEMKRQMDHKIQSVIRPSLAFRILNKIKSRVS